MKQNDFDAELERYLHARRRPRINFRESFSKFWPKRKPDHIDLQTGVEVYDKPSLLERVKLKKDQVVASLKKAESKSEQPCSDIKEVAKIALGVIRQLPDEELKRFKQSADFETLKEILKKHELIR